jgi:hypothetical protein
MNAASGYERGMKELCCAIIEQAVQDYKGLVASGKVKGLVITPKGRASNFKCKGEYSSNAQIEDLLWFLNPESNALPRLLETAGIDVEAESIWKALGI